MKTILIKGLIMGTRQENMRALDKGFKALEARIKSEMAARLDGVCRMLLEEVAKQREFLGFTGQTQTSYMAAWYYGGEKRIFGQENWNRPPVRGKVKKGETAFLERPYEGRARSVTGKVGTNEAEAKDTSYNFLNAYKPKHGCWAIVVTTGTEYSEFIESVYNLDVLTKTYIASRAVIRKVMEVN